MKTKLLSPIFILFLMLATANISYAHPKLRCMPKEAQAIKVSIEKYLDTHDGISSKDVFIINLRCLKSYAIAQVNPKKPVTDMATIILHKEKNSWKVLSLGTDFDQKLLSKLPKGLSPYQ